MINSEVAVATTLHRLKDLWLFSLQYAQPISLQIKNCSVLGYSMLKTIAALSQCFSVAQLSLGTDIKRKREVT